MRINVEILGAKDARDKLAAMAGRLKNLRPAYTHAGLVVLRTAQERIQQSGPGWAPQAVGPNGETRKGRLLYRTGALSRSLTENAEGNIFEDLTDGVKVGTGLKTPDGRYNIGQLMQYGRRAITAPPGKSLRFVIDGRVIYAKSVKASPARKFLYISPNTAQAVAAVFVQRIKGEI